MELGIVDDTLNPARWPFGLDLISFNDQIELLNTLDERLLATVLVLGKEAGTVARADVVSQVFDEDISTALALEDLVGRAYDGRGWPAGDVIVAEMLWC